MDLPRDEMAFRKLYQPLVVERKLTTVFRPGNRLFPNYRGYKLHEVITARIIEVPGSDEKNVAPQFNEIKMPVQISHIEKLDLSAMTEQHFEGSSPDVQSVDDLIEHLGSIYSRPPEEYNHEVTRIAFSYIRVTQTA